MQKNYSMSLFMSLLDGVMDGEMLVLNDWACFSNYSSKSSDNSATPDDIWSTVQPISFVWRRLLKLYSNAMPLDEKVIIRNCLWFCSNQNKKGHMNKRPNVIQLDVNRKALIANLVSYKGKSGRWDVCASRWSARRVRLWIDDIVRKRWLDRERVVASGINSNGR